MISRYHGNSRCQIRLYYQYSAIERELEQGQPPQPISAQYLCALYPINCLKLSKEAKALKHRDAMRYISLIVTIDSDN